MSIEEVPPGYRKTDVGVIPEEWNLVLLPEVVIRGTDSIRIGPFGSSLKKEYLTKEGYKVFGQENVFTNDMVIGDRYIDTALFRKLRSYEILPEDFLISMMGTVGQCIVAPKGIEPGIMDSHLLRLRLNQEKILPKFLLQIFESWLILEQTKRLSVGGIMEGLSSTIIRHIKIPLPPLPEQRAIAAALSDADALITSLDTLIEKKRAIKQAAMQQLLTGRTRLPGFSGEWRVTTLGEIVDIRNGATPSTQIPAYWNGQILWCTPTDITGTSGKYLLATERSITVEGLENCAASLLPVGALLLCTRATIGEIKIAASPVCTNQGFKSLVCKNGISNEFLYYLLLTLKPQMIERAIGSTFLEIGKRDVASIKLRLPQHSEQHAIATVLSDMDAEIAALEQRLEKAQQIKQGMMQQLLTGKVRLVGPEHEGDAVRC